ncbi:hypothetical protein FRX31_021517 [Thalictrum thalictroides]|uniref:Secreted protein n=1 Tax=Thalictrum thalictroides TaxID=46969 RepID=A0A7J6VUW7_THATH|nr:hypothetical protein FRX31_021517 [Thalictrum thalictroides]
MVADIMSWPRGLVIILTTIATFQGSMPAQHTLIRHSQIVLTEMYNLTTGLSVRSKVGILRHACIA